MSENERAPYRMPSLGLLEDALARSHRENAMFMNQIRCALATGFLIVYIVAIWGLEDPSLLSTLPHLGLYWVMTLVLWIFGGRTSWSIGLSRYAVPLIDLPISAWIQHTTAKLSENGETVAVFTLGLFLFLIVLSSFSLRPQHLFVTAMVAVLGLLYVYSAAELSVLSMLSGPFLLILAAGMMAWFPKRQRALIVDATERQAERDRLARYFSPGVAEVIERHDEPTTGESCEISVLFCDIRGFTRLSEHLEAASVVALLNEFHGYMVEAVFLNGGTLDKYLGDGLLAYFNAPVRQSDHAVRAVRCALAMVERLRLINEGRSKAGSEPLEIGIGVHSGVAVVGNIGASIRREFTAIGDTVNVASRIQSLTKEHDCPVLISDAVVSLIRGSGNDEFRFVSVGSESLRGREQEVGLFIPELAATGEQA